MPESVKLGTAYYIDYMTSHPTSGARDADVNPRFWVFKNADSTGLSSSLNGALFSYRGNFPGNYYATIPVTTGDGFTTGVFYNVVASGNVAGVTRYENIRTFYAEAYTADDLASSLSDVYFADINYNMDDVNSKDEITVCWYKNNQPYSGFTSPKLTIFKRSDGTTFLAETNMTGIGANYLGAKYDTVGSSNRLLEGEAYLIMTTATIDSSVRSWYRLVSRDVRVL